MKIYYKNFNPLLIFWFLKNYIFIGLLMLFISQCKKDPKSVTPLETSTVTDVEGNIYKTVKIGTQWWMAENLKVKKYCNGDNIALIKNQDTANWRKIKSGAYSDNNTEVYYNWFAVNDSRKLSPEGWHIPSDEEWKILEKYLGMTQTEVEKIGWRGTNQGNKLKIEAQKTGILYSWKESSNIYEVWGTNESGFTARAFGCRMFNGSWGDPGPSCVGFWWSSSEQNNDVWYRYLDYKKANVFRFYGPKTYGFSIRCVKD